MHLLIDLGNSRLKWALSRPGHWLTGVATHKDVDIATLLDGLWSGILAPERIVMSSVANEKVRHAIEYWTQVHWGSTPHLLNPSREQLGLINGYREPGALGADRWAALLGARGMSRRAFAVVDCGTAVTVDAVSGDGVFSGGVIMPGLRLLRMSIGAGTARVGFGEGNDSSCLGRATADCVAAGAAFGLVGAIERCLKEQERALDEELDVFLTGGDAPKIASRLERQTTLEPDLVLKGLARVAEAL